MYTERIELEGARNTRDLGGMSAAGGKKIREGRLIRSGMLHTVTDADCKLLLNLGLKRVIDFRTHIECEQMPDVVMPGVTYTNLPVLTEAAMGITRERADRVTQLSGMLEQFKLTGTDEYDHMREMYDKIIRSEHAMGAYRRFFEVLLTCEDGAALWHCTAGKDRAGLGAALVEFALGVPESVVKQDYLATNRFVKEINRAHMDYLISCGGSERIAEMSNVMMSVHESYFDTVTDYFEQQYGGADGYLAAIGVGESEKKQLRALYLEN